MIRIMLPLVLLAIFFVLLPFYLAQDEPALRPTAASQPRAGLPVEFVEKKLTLPDKSERKYVVYVPPQYEDNKDHRWPVILFLHGSRECGTDNIRHTKVGLPAYIRRNLDRFPFIVVMPQAHEMWFRGKNMVAVWTALENTLREYRTDRDRVYLTGLSMGGYGAWELASFQPDVFAAVVPVCGAAPIDYLSNMVNTPVWAFHGSDDSNVPVAGSRQAIARLKELGGSPKYTEYAGQRHKIWDTVYSSKKLWRWLLAQRRPPPPRKIDYLLPAPIGRVWWLTVRGEPGKIGQARIRAEVSEENVLRIDGQNIHSWAVVSNREPLKPGSEITIVLGDEQLYRGPFPGSVAYNVTASTQPAASQPEGMTNGPGAGESEAQSPPEAP